MRAQRGQGAAEEKKQAEKMRERMRKRRNEEELDGNERQREGHKHKMEQEGKRWGVGEVCCSVLAISHFVTAPWLYGEFPVMVLLFN